MWERGTRTRTTSSSPGTPSLMTASRKGTPEPCTSSGFYIASVLTIILFISLNIQILRDQLSFNSVRTLSQHSRWTMAAYRTKPSPTTSVTRPPATAFQYLTLKGKQKDEWRRPSAWHFYCIPEARHQRYQGGRGRDDQPGGQRAVGGGGEPDGRGQGLH